MAVGCLTWAIRLAPKGIFAQEPWQLGGNPFPVLHGDTLRLALGVAWRELHGCGSPPLLSSAFPYWGEELLFPFPELPWLGEQRGTLTSLVSGVAFRRMLEGDAPALREATPGVYLAGEAPEGSPWLLVNAARVPVDRASARSAWAERFPAVRFDPSAGWFVLFRGEPPLVDAVVAAFRLLGLTGVGRARSSGLGAFEVRGVEPWREPLVECLVGYVLLAPLRLKSPLAGHALIRRRSGVALPEGTFLPVGFPGLEGAFTVPVSERRLAGCRSA